MKVGLALGGGAAKGLAHFGVLKALKKADIPIHVITGTSIGSIIASLYAANPDIDEIIKTVSLYLNSPDFNQTKLDFIRKGDQESNSYLGQIKKFLKAGFFFAVSMQRSSFISAETIRDNLTKLLPSQMIEECKIPLGLVSMDLNNGEEVNFTRGSLIDSVLSSCAIPGVFPPIAFEDKLLVDGSWVTPVPIKLARDLGADFVIAIDVAPELNEFTEGQNGWSITIRANECTRIANKRYCLEKADYTVSLDVQNIHWADFLQLDKCVREGEQIIFEEVEKIRKKLFWHQFKITWPWS